MWATPLLLVSMTTAASGNLLLSATQRLDKGVERSAVVRDGKIPFEGDFWDNEWTAKVAPDGALEWDLGQLTPVQAILLQGDNNDVYVVSGSEDGVNWSTLWRSPVDPLPGMRTRTGRDIGARARYLRLTAEGGDKSYSVGEFQVFADNADLKPELLSLKPRPAKPEPRFDMGWVIVLGVIAVFVWFFRERTAENRLRAARAEAAEKLKT